MRNSWQIPLIVHKFRTSQAPKTQRFSLEEEREGNPGPLAGVPQTRFILINAVPSAYERLRPNCRPLGDRSADETHLGPFSVWCVIRTERLQSTTVGM
jgi:hypothetical protein